MSGPDRQAVAQACRVLLRPVASLLLRCGMTWREFSDLSKSVFVEVASQEYGLSGRPTNVSRVSILTGISRKEVKRQRELLAAPAAPVPRKTNDATRVLSAWHQDPRFADGGGQPRVLPPTGPESFATLCADYGGDLPAVALRKELLRVGVVEETPAGLQAVRRYYMPVQFDTEWLLNAGGVLRDLAANINHNLVAGGDQPTHFLGRATNDRMPARELPAFRAFLDRLGQSFLEQVDDWLTAHQDTGEAAGSRRGSRRPVRLGTGVFLIHGSDAD